MAFFRPHTQPEPNFNGLFRLLEDWDKHHQKAQPAAVNHRRTSSRTPTFTPKFDVRETETAYELHGELPGLDKKDISIEFSDPQTLVIRGRVERTRITDNHLALPESEAGEEPVLVDHATDDEDHHETSSQRSFKATVEDDTEDESTASVAATPATTVAEAVKPAPVAAAPVAPKHKYWISERNVGEFARSFAFPSRIEVDSVGAALESGILTVTVPKAKRYEARRINLL